MFLLAGAGSELLGDDIRPDRIDASVTALETAVLRASREHEAWPAKVAAGIRAALDFAAQNPAAAGGLTVELRACSPATAERHLRVVERFSILLREAVPADRGLPLTADEALVGAVATVVAHHVRLGTEDRLPEAAGDLAFLALLPRLGFARASRASALG